MQLFGYLLSPFLHSERMIRANAQSLNIPEEFMEEYVSNSKLISRQAFMRINKEALKFEVPTEAKNADIPALFLAGEKEHSSILTSLPYYKKNFVQAESYIANGVSHGWSIEAPDLFAETVRQWVNGESLPKDLILVHE